MRETLIKLNNGKKRGSIKNAIMLTTASRATVHSWIAEKTFRNINGPTKRLIATFLVLDDKKLLSKYLIKEIEDMEALLCDINSPNDESLSKE